MKIRDFALEDLPAVLAIQRECPQAAQWLAADYAHLANNPGPLLLVAEVELEAATKVAGFATFHQLFDEADLRNLAVAPEYRRRGVARALIEAACDRLRQTGTKRLFLEVRVSNEPALSLYQALGFVLNSRRKDYYRNPDEDAYVLCLELSPPSRV
jgi:[ribosomal protein S18]-alanine N-acetyltransferase